MRMQFLELSLPNAVTPPSLPPSGHFFPPASLFDQPIKRGVHSTLVGRLHSSLRKLSKPLVSMAKSGASFRVQCGMAEHDEGFYMRRCVELAKSAIGHTSPNPMVGCVIVKDGKVVGEGFHPKAGQPHAEVFALRDAGDLTENATAYVSLEPCNHHGRTPPCTEALIKAKVKKVVVGMVDPNPIVAAKGVNKLKAAGIDVTVGVEEELCKKLNEAYIHRMLTGKPLVALRYSISLNGRILDQLGEEAMECGGYYSKLLQEYDAVILSSTSLTEKLPLPSSQEPRANQPLRIVIAKGSNRMLKVPSLTGGVNSNLIIFTDVKGIIDSKAPLEGIETVILDQINLNAILDYCGRQGLCSVLMDIRGDINDFEELLKEGIEENMLQKIMVETLPLWTASDEGNVNNLSSMAGMRKVKNLQPRVFHQSIVLEGYF